MDVITVLDGIQVLEDGVIVIVWKGFCVEYS